MYGHTSNVDDFERSLKIGKRVYVLSGNINFTIFACLTEMLFFEVIERQMFPVESKHLKADFVMIQIVTFPRQRKGLSQPGKKSGQSCKQKGR